MKKLFTIVSILSLTIVSFYYTNEVVNYGTKMVSLIKENEMERHIIIDVNNYKLENLYNLIKEKDLKLSFSIDDKTLKDNKKLIEQMILEGYDFYYKGSSKKSLEKYKKALNYLGVKPKCILTDKNKDICNDNILSITPYYIKSYPLITIKKIIPEEKYIVIIDTKSNLTELNIIASFLVNKGYLMV